jgi:hypothetical protein
MHPHIVKHIVQVSSTQDDDDDDDDDDDNVHSETYIVCLEIVLHHMKHVSSRSCAMER